MRGGTGSCSEAGRHAWHGLWEACMHVACCARCTSLTDSLVARLIRVVIVHDGAISLGRPPLSAALPAPLASRSCCKSREI